MGGEIRFLWDNRCACLCVCAHIRWYKSDRRRHASIGLVGSVIEVVRNESCLSCRDHGSDLDSDFPSPLDAAIHQMFAEMVETGVSWASQSSSHPKNGYRWNGFAVSGWRKLKVLLVDDKTFPLCVAITRSCGECVCLFRLSLAELRLAGAG